MKLLPCALGLTLLFMLGCSDDAPSGSSSAGSTSTTATSSTGTGAGGMGGSGGSGGAGGAGGAGGGVVTGPVAIDIDTDPNGLLWDSAENTLYLTDDVANTLLQWTDADGFSKVADLPPTAATGPGLGQMVRLADGSFVIPRFGFGTAGDVIVVMSDLSSIIVTGLDPVRRRTGLTLLPDGTMFISGFVGSGMNKVGFLSQLSIDAGGSGVETDVAIAGLKKPVGVLDVGADLYISDQDLMQILRAPLATPDQAALFAGVPSADLLVEGPAGSLLTGGKLGEIYQIDNAGTGSVFQAGFQEVRGLAYDAVHGRLFVVDHDGDASDGVTNKLHILPLGG